MPLIPTQTGFDIRYARGKCAVFTLVALPFAALMAVTAANTFTPFLQDTALDWLVIERRPQLVYAAISIAGSLVPTSSFGTLSGYSETISRYASMERGSSRGL